MIIKDFNEEQMDNLNKDVVDFYNRGFNGEITFETYDDEVRKLAEKHNISRIEMAHYICAVVGAFGG